MKDYISDYNLSIAAHLHKQTLESSNEEDRAEELRFLGGPLFRQIYLAFVLNIELPEAIKKDYINAVERWVRDPNISLDQALAGCKDAQKSLAKSKRADIYRALEDIDAIKQALIDEKSYDGWCSRVEGSNWRASKDATFRSICRAVEFSRLDLTKRVRVLLKEKYGEEHLWPKEVASITKGYKRYIQKQP